MTEEKIKELVSSSEKTRTEFKSCTNQVSSSVYETVCSFANRSGGVILLGVDDDGTIIGVNKKASSDISKNIINTLGNKQQFFPTLRVEPELLEVDGKCIISLEVPVNQYPVKFKNRYFDRVGDADQDITDNVQRVLDLFERKNPHLFEERLVPGLKIEELDKDTFESCRRIVSIFQPNHPWMDMSDLEILESCKLVEKNSVGEILGYKYAALLLFGQEDAIQKYLPRYRFELLFHKMTYARFEMNLPEDTTRYDDRKTLRCNIIKAYSEMMDFVQRYLPDKFYLAPSGTTHRSDLRNQLFREVFGNICAHTDYQIGYAGYVEVFYDRVTTLNATRLIPMQKEGNITLDELGQFTKNPLIVRVLTEVRIVEDLGSGKRNIKKYAPLYYPNYEVKITNGDMFQFSITYQDKKNDMPVGQFGEINGEINGGINGEINGEIKILYSAIKANPYLSQPALANATGISYRNVSRFIKTLKENGYIRRVGSNKTGRWEILK